MCGIGGFYAPPGAHVDRQLMATLWTALEDRGRHAAGVSLFWRDSDAPVAFKSAKPASRMVEEIQSRMGCNTQFIALHTRYTTQGSTEDNNNNHPVCRAGIMLTHNGVIRNDSNVFSALGVDRSYDVDTECIVAGLAVKGPTWTFNKINGSASVAWIDTITNPEVVNLFTNGKNPLVIGRLLDGTVVWASCSRHIEQLPIATYWHAVPGKIYSLLPDGTIEHEHVAGKWPEPMWDGYARVY